MDIFGKREKKRVALFSMYSAVFNSEEGKKVLDDLMRTFGVVEGTFDPDPYQHAYNEGARSVVVRILKTINTDPEQFNKIVKGQLEEDYDL